MQFYTLLICLPFNRGISLSDSKTLLLPVPPSCHCDPESLGSDFVCSVWAGAENG